MVQQKSLLVFQFSGTHTFMAFIGSHSFLPSQKSLDAARFLLHRALLPLQAQTVRDHGDELRIRGLALDAAHRVAEELLEGLHVAPVPGHLDGVADGPLHPGRGGC